MMRNRVPGRNDPCHCGSGKKYKRCCLAQDELRAAQERMAATQPEEYAAPQGPAPDPRQIPAMLQELARKSSSKEARAEFEDLLARTGPLLKYAEQQPAIEAAGKALEAHRAEFEKLAEDGNAYQKRAEALFSEDKFAALRFTAEDVRRAFDKVGAPGRVSSNDAFVETVRKAILHLADKDCRNRLAMEMLLHLPDYVAANRPLDAWIIQHCAYLTQEETDQSNAFLFHMFSYGYDAWTAEGRRRDTAMLREMGLDLSRLEGMSMEEIEAWLQEQQADPAKLARMEELMRSNPTQRAQAEATLQQMEKDAHKLLEREDAAHLLLSPDEMHPWLPRLKEAWISICEKFPDLPTSSASPAAGKAFVDALAPLVREMVVALFTPDRLEALAADLKAYRNALFAAGDKKTSELANGATISVKDEDEPGSNRFLFALGYFSLVRSVGTLAAESPEQAP